MNNPKEFISRTVVSQPAIYVGGYSIGFGEDGDDILPVLALYRRDSERHMAFMFDNIEQMKSLAEAMLEMIAEHGDGKETVRESIRREIARKGVNN